MSNGMSRKTYACFICEKNGYPDERVYLAGKDANGKTIYLEPDGVTAHQHKRKETSNTTSSQQQPTTTNNPCYNRRHNNFVTEGNRRKVRQVVSNRRTLILDLQNRHGDYLFADKTYDNTVHFTLVDKKGNIIRAAELPIILETFEKSMHKAGYKHVNF